MRWETFDRLVMWQQTLFGLPWVVTTLCLAWLTCGSVQPLSWALFFWLGTAFISARVSGMAFNRLIDQEIDAHNPRTVERSLPSGEVTSLQVAILGLGSIALFVISCGMLSPRCLALSPLALALLWAYSYTKRVTSCCHFALGMVHFLTPLFVWTAICPQMSPVPFLLGAALMTSIAGSDIVYAMLDVEFDRSYRLHSIPLLLGTERAIFVAKLLHTTTVVLLAFLGLLLSPPSLFYFLGVAAVGALYVHCYLKLRPEIPEQLHLFLSNCNKRVALTFMVFCLIAVS